MYPIPVHGLRSVILRETDVQALISQPIFVSFLYFPYSLTVKMSPFVSCINDHSDLRFFLYVKHFLRQATLLRLLLVAVMK